MISRSAAVVTIPPQVAYPFRIKRPAWPNTNLSIGDEYEPLMVRIEAALLLDIVVRKMRCWDAVGPALDAYKEVCDNIQSILDSDDVKDGELKDEPGSFGFYMVGTDEARARPTIIIH